MEVGLAVGGAVLSSALNVFFDRMTPKFSSLFQGVKDADKIFKKLRRLLRAIEAVLDDAEDKQITNRHVYEWVNELKDTVYDAEDLVDEINTEILRLEIEGGEQSLNHTVSQLPIEFLKEIIPKIEEIVTNLEDFVSQINVLGLERVVTKRDYPYRLPSTSLVDEAHVYGRDNEREKLIQMVLSDGANGNNVGVIPIVGMGGLGKTTLAQVIYGDERVNEHFDTKAWVCVSENYDAFRITKTLVNEVTHGGSEEKDEFNRLQVKLKECLAKKKFLIVLDDIWNDNYNDWDKLKAPLEYGEKGSKIVVTTRDEKVAFMMRTEPIHYLESINEGDCWSLFKKHAFDNDSPLASPEFEKIGKEIIKKCDGLPLAVKTLGGLLRSKREIKEWDRILKSEFWTLENESNDVLPVLRLSYHHLPPHLKHCFSFCALFPKNYHFDGNALVLLWMANGLVQHPTQNDRTIEDLGRECLNELISRSFFQKVRDDKYLMHDLINDLARYVSGMFCVRLEDCRQGEIPSKVRHFSYMSETYNAYEKFKFLIQVKSLRTFFPVRSAWHHKITKLFLSDILPRLGGLRVLNLCNYNITQLPNSICKLKHLRSINLSRTLIEQLPDAICDLYNLQTLLLTECQELHMLPKNFTKLVNLRHLYLRGTKLLEMPKHMGRLKNLQTLSYFIVESSSSSNIEELGKLQLHGYLKISQLENVISCNDALKANLKNKKHLKFLVLQWGGNTNDSQIAKDIFDKLQPHANLKSLMIDGYGGTRFADWLGDDSFCNIVSLCLKNCRNCFLLPTLGHLSSLKSLVISGLDRIREIGQEFYGNGSLIKPFQSLVRLRIEQMSELEEWDTSENAEFFALEELYIEDCPNLKGELPSQLLCLTTLAISGCPKLVFPNNWMTTSQNNQVGLRSRMSYMRISGMPLSKELPGELLRLGVHELEVRDCANIVSLRIVDPSANMERLLIENCPKFEFPTIGENSNGWYISFPELQSLALQKCEHLKIFPAPRGIQSLTLLRELRIESCDNLLSFPGGGLQAPNLEYFHVYNCKKLKSYPEQMHSLLPCLRIIVIQYCPEIECFPEGGLPQSLETLKIWSCRKLMRRPRDWGLQSLHALTALTIGGNGDEEDLFPDEQLLPSSLRELYIRNHKKLKTLNEMSLLRLTSVHTISIDRCPNLVSLTKEGLPTSLQTLYLSKCPKLESLPKEGLPISLQYLRIWDCPNLVSLPDAGLPTSLLELNVEDCPKLKPLLERERGKYWPIISYIPIILLGRELIS